MNAKQLAPAFVTAAPAIAAAPPLLLIGGLVLLGVWLLSDDEEKKPETAPVAVPVPPERPVVHVPAPTTGNLSFPVNSGNNTVQNRDIPPISAGKLTLTHVPSVPSSAADPVSSVPAPKIPVTPPPAIPAAKIQPGIPPPAQRKIITREDMAKIFDGGRGMTRKSTVFALKALGFGKTAAYQALEIDGRFAQWLQFASDGIITWKN